MRFLISVRSTRSVNRTSPSPVKQCFQHLQDRSPITSQSDSRYKDTAGSRQLEKLRHRIVLGIRVPPRRKSQWRGVLQGSVLGPILFCLRHIGLSRGVKSELSADDFQIQDVSSSRVHGSRLDAQTEVKTMRLQSSFHGQSNHVVKDSVRNY